MNIKTEDCDFVVVVYSKEELQTLPLTPNEYTAFILDNDKEDYQKDPEYYISRYLYKNETRIIYNSTQLDFQIPHDCLELELNNNKQFVIK